MDPDSIEEFAAYAKLKLIDRDYAIIRNFKGRSSFRTFMNVVIGRLLNGYRDHLWGRWRNSAEACRLGPMAMDLERLWVRDTCSLREAFSDLAPKYPGITFAELEELAGRLPPRQRRKVISIDESIEPETPQGSAEIERIETASRISSAVAAFIERLPAEDQLIFQLRFEHGLPVPKIARALGRDAQSLYGCLRTRCRALRVKLEKMGITAADAAALSVEGRALLDFRLKIADRRPSMTTECPGGFRESA